MALSIGTVGSVIWDPTSIRFKGLMPQAHESITSAVRQLAEIADSCKGASGDTRFTVRLIFTREVDHQLIRSIQLPWLDTSITCEAFIPLRTSDLGGLAYFGANRPIRASTTATREAEWNLLSTILGAPSRRRELADGFRYEILTPDLREEDVNSLLDIYCRCFTDYMTAFTPETIRSMLEENRVVGIRHPKGEIIAVGQAEEVKLETGRGKLRLIELSENATHPDFQGLGLSQHCRYGLMQLLGEEGGNTLFYAEARSGHGSVLSANHKVGLRVAGRLDHHARCDSNFKEVVQEGAFASFFVFYRPQNEET